MDFTKQDLIDALKTVFPNSGPAPSTPTGGANADGANKSLTNFSGYIQNVTTKFGDLAGTAIPLGVGLEKLRTGADGANIAADGLKSVLTTVSGSAGLGGLGKASGFVIDSLMKTREDMNKTMAETGVGNNNLGQFVRLSGEAGLSTAQFGEVMKTNMPSIIGMGSNATKSAEAFSKLQKGLLESKAGEGLMLAGISAQEMANYTALSMNMSRNRDTRTEAGQKLVQESAAKLAYEIDATSRITGQSREQVAKTLQAEAEKTDSILAMNLLTKEQRKSLEEFNSKSAVLGPAFANLATEVTSKGAVVSEKNLAIIASLGPAGIEYVNAIKMAKEAKTKEEKEAAAAAQERAIARVLEKTNDASYARQNRTASGEQAEAINAVVQSTKGAAAALRSEQESTGKGAVEAYRSIKDTVTNNQGGKTDKGEVDKDQQIARQLNEVNVRATQSMGGLAKTVDDGAQAIQRNQKAMNALTDTVNLIGGRGNMKDKETAYKQAPEKMTNQLSSLGNAVLGTDDKNSAAPANTGKKDAYGRNVPVHGEGGIINGPELAVIAEKGPEAVVPLDKLKDMMGGVSMQISSASSPAGGSSVGALDNKQYLDQWKKNYEEQTVVMIGTEKRQAQEDIQYAEARITSKSAKIKELEDIKATRELTESEQRQLALAQRGKARAEQNLASDQARLAVLETIDKTGLTNQANMAEKFIAGQADTKEAQETAMKLVTEGASEILKINGKIMDPSGPEAKEVMAKMSVSKAEIDKVMAETMGIKASAPSDSKASAPSDSKASAPSDSKASTTVSSGLGGYNPFKPVIKDQAAADEQKAKIAAQKASLAKQAPDQSDAETKRLASANAAAASKPGAEKKDPAKADKTSQKETSLKDLNDQLIALNKHMMQLISHNANIADHTKETARAKPAGQRLGS